MRENMIIMAGHSYACRTMNKSLGIYQPAAGSRDPLILLLSSGSRQQGTISTFSKGLVMK